MDVVVKFLGQNRKAVYYVTGTAVVLFGLALVYRSSRRQRKLTQVGVVSQLLLHPLKSGKAVCVDSAECLRIGLKCGELQDRHWMVITEDGHMVTGRQEPRLVLLSLTCEGGELCLNAPEMEELRIPVHQPQNPIFKCRVFSSDTEGRDCGDKVSNWITRYLAADKTYRLVHYEPSMKTRSPGMKGFPKDEKHLAGLKGSAANIFVSDTTGHLQRSCTIHVLEDRKLGSKRVAYPDAAPVMLMSEASVNNLSSKLSLGISVYQFRPSIVISNCEPFSEDTWDHVQIGQIEMQRVMGCGRCIFTTVDPETGVITRKEPLNTLKTYRLIDPEQKTSPILGQYYTIKKTGILRVGEPIYKISY